MAGPGICILCLADNCASYVLPVFNPVAPYRVLSVADSSNPDLLGCACRIWISLDIAQFYEDNSSHAADPQK